MIIRPPSGAKRLERSIGIPRSPISGRKQAERAAAKGPLIVMVQYIAIAITSKRTSGSVGSKSLQ